MKFQFLPNPKSKARDLARVLEDIPYKARLGEFADVVIPECYETDFASIPDGLVMLMHPNSKKVRMASLGHDFIWDERIFFQKKLRLTGKQLKKLSNIEYRYRCMADGTDWFRAWVMYLILQYHPKANRWFWEVESGYERIGRDLEAVGCTYALPMMGLNETKM